MDVILGAGLSGLICGALNAQAHIYERNPASFVEHKAVLRFRSNKIALALGLNFRPVTVRKAIWMSGGEVVRCTPRLANFYSMKVRNVLGDNSIWNLAPSERFIAPDDLHAILADICGPRVTWECNIDLDWMVKRRGDRVTSTIPLPLLLKMLGTSSDLPFAYSPIHVARYHVAGCDLFQTIYFPDPATGIYRATLTGSLLTVESIKPIHPGDTNEVAKSFGLQMEWLQPIELQHRQTFGKITPVPDGPRKALLHRLTTDFGIYSLGRFATWRNILLDDVYDDIAQIRKMKTLHQYDVNIERTKQ